MINDLTTPQLEFIKSLFGANWAKVVTNPDQYALTNQEKEIVKEFQEIIKR